MDIKEINGYLSKVLNEATDEEIQAEVKKISAKFEALTQNCPLTFEKDMNYNMGNGYYIKGTSACIAINDNTFYDLDEGDITIFGLANENVGVDNDTKDGILFEKSINVGLQDSEIDTILRDLIKAIYEYLKSEI